MKKVITSLCIIALLLTMAVPVFARPADCPYDGCDGTFKSMETGEWHWVDDTSNRNTGPMLQPQVWTYQERTVTIHCSEKTHTTTENKYSEGHYRDVSWLEGYFK